MADVKVETTVTRRTKIKGDNLLGSVGVKKITLYTKPREQRKDFRSWERVSIDVAPEHVDQIINALKSAKQAAKGETDGR